MKSSTNIYFKIEAADHKLLISTTDQRTIVIRFKYEKFNNTGVNTLTICWNKSETMPIYRVGIWVHEHTLVHYGEFDWILNQGLWDCYQWEQYLASDLGFSNRCSWFFLEINHGFMSLGLLRPLLRPGGTLGLSWSGKWKSLVASLDVWSFCYKAP